MCAAARTTDAPPAMTPILRAAQHCFVEQGYHGTSIRVIATRAGLSVPGLYHHHRSKQEMLQAIVRTAMESLHQQSVEALDAAGEDPTARFDALVACLVRFHAYEREQAFLAYSEIRSLDDEAREAHIGRRDIQQRLMDTVVDSGVARGLFTTPHPVEASRAVVTMCTSVAQWYRSDGPLTPEALVERYLDIARMTVGGRH
ncbi:TetR family transcriptional regulator [Aeromicrobium sp. YIM 150415]|uniref:TetR/AcrR family transcriptional regulator n=1 Tax=Aeromicrobium sp. YIM 150415 TaxID=2803912 RepID=UPI0019630735|nr:TetR/AcrR family transcriptional regulator [Aeromicrobium sp. YIM 150415]MBM9463947.1 TetR family transcriptional regulator [Aeromicrobium sp. YIM 150415]